MATRAKRTSAWGEARQGIARARQLAEKYGIPEAHPGDFIHQPPEQQADWDALLNQIK